MCARVRVYVLCAPGRTQHIHTHACKCVYWGVGGGGSVGECFLLCALESVIVYVLVIILINGNNINNRGGGGGGAWGDGEDNGERGNGSG